jgi:Zn-dependent metalloprotease
MGILAASLIALSVTGLSQDSSVVRKKTSSVGKPSTDSVAVSGKDSKPFRSNLAQYGLQVDHLDEEKVDSICVQYFHDNNLALNELKKSSVTRAVGSWTCRYLQTVDGVPVVGTSVGIRISRKGVIHPFSQSYPHVNCGTSPTIGADSALAITFGLFRGTDTQVHEGPELTILPRGLDDSKEFALTWRIWLLKAKPIADSHEYYVSARDGSIIKDVSLMRQ